MKTGMKMSELTEMNRNELSAKRDDLKQMLFNLRFQHSTGQLENTSRLKQVRADIARVLTALNALSTTTN